MPWSSGPQIVSVGAANRLGDSQATLALGRRRNPSCDAVPEYVEGKIVSAGEAGLLLKIRHAQDTDILDEALAEAEIVVRAFDGDAFSVESGRRQVFEGMIALPRGRLSIGDADGEVLVELPVGSHYVVVSVAEEVTDSPDSIRVDLFRRAA